MERRDIFRSLDIPQFGRIAGLKTLFEVVGAGGTVSQDPAGIGKCCIQGGHGRCCVFLLALCQSALCQSALWQLALWQSAGCWLAGCWLSIRDGGGLAVAQRRSRRRAGREAHPATHAGHRSSSTARRRFQHRYENTPYNGPKPGQADKPKYRVREGRHCPSHGSSRLIPCRWLADRPSVRRRRSHRHRAASRHSAPRARCQARHVPRQQACHRLF